MGENGTMAGGTSQKSEGTAVGRCTGNCMVCTIFQRQYCASQLAYSNMRMLEQMQRTIVELDRKMEAMQNNEAMLIEPCGAGTSPDGEGTVAGMPDGEASGVVKPVGEATGVVKPVGEATGVVE